MAAPTNRALWQDAAKAPGAIRESPLPTSDDLGDDKVLVKVHAWAVNPCDHMVQDREVGQYSMILGCDIAGTVEAVVPGSPAAAKFSAGDRVFGFNANNNFQDHVAVEHRLIARIPDAMAYLDAVGLGLCSATSAMLLFGEHYLHLEMPQLGAAREENSILVWGGSSSVGSNAIQLAAGAGYDVVATCSRRNFDYVKGLGASLVFDYSDPDVAERITAELDRTECAGIFMAAGLDDGNAAALKVAVAMKHSPKQVNFASSNFILDLGKVPGGVVVKQPTPEAFVPFPKCWFETSQTTFGGYLPEALAKGVYKAAPPPLVVNKKGLEGIQEAIDIQRGISEKGQEGVREAVERAGDDSMNASVSVVKVVVERPLDG